MSQGDEILKFVDQKIHQLEAQKDTSQGKANLANLRRGVGKSPGDVPMVWGVFLADMPEDFHANSGVSKAEWACYTALTLFALHQQGQEKSMHADGETLGSALKKLADKMGDDNAEERVLRRINMLAQARDIDGIRYHLRSIVYLLRSEQISLDYGKLAKDIFYLQFPEYAPDIHLRWGREFYSTNHKEKKEPEGE